MMRFSRCLASAALLSLIAAAVSAQRLYEFEEERAAVGVAAGAASRSLSGPDDGAFTPAARALPVRLDLDLLQAAPDTLGFPTPDGETLWAVRSRFHERERGGYEWRGYIPGSIVDSVLLVGDSRGLFGTFGTETGQHYEIFGTRNRARVRPIVYGVVPEDRHTSPRILHGDADPTSLESVEAAAAASTSAATTTYTIDVLVLYTEEAENFWKSDYGSYSVDHLVGYAKAYANQAFENSNTPARIRIAHHQRMPKDADPGPGYGWASGDTLDYLTEDKEVAKLRAAHNADVVLAFVYGTQLYCGLAWHRGNGWIPGRFAANAFAFVNNWCNAGGKTWRDPYWLPVPHEIAHLMGADHDHANSPVDPSIAIGPHAHGYINTVDNVRTVMGGCASNHWVWRNHGWNWECKQVKIQYFSSVTPHPDGYTLGMAGQAENDRVIRATAEDTTTFGKYIVKPAKPTNLTGTPSVIHGSVLLRWTDNADNEYRYVVKYRRAGQQWANADEEDYPSRVPNVEKANIHGLEPGKLYTFRVAAVNAGGSASSNKIRLRTGGPR